MAAEVESMFYVREKPWHGMGQRVITAPSSKDALHLAGLDWQVLQQPICTGSQEIPGYKAERWGSCRKRYWGLCSPSRASLTIFTVYG